MRADSTTFALFREGDKTLKSRNAQGTYKNVPAQHRSKREISKDSTNDFISDKALKMMKFYKKKIENQPILEPEWKKLQQYFPKIDEIHDRRLFFQPAVIQRKDVQLSKGKNSQMTTFQLRSCAQSQ